MLLKGMVGSQGHTLFWHAICNTGKTFICRRRFLLAKQHSPQEEVEDKREKWKRREEKRGRDDDEGCRRKFLRVEESPGIELLMDRVEMQKQMSH